MTAVLKPAPNPADPTSLQRAASAPDTSVWVNASAGSGKTTILTNRVLRLLLTGVRPERILCLTFTRAAAAEMALRVTSRLSHWAVCGDNELNALLSDLQGRRPLPEEMTRARRLFAAALGCPGGMRIRTLHAFGQEVLRRFPVEANLPPHFTVIEDDDARTLQDDILLQQLRDDADNPALHYLLEQLGEKAFRQMMGVLLQGRDKIAAAVTHHGSVAALATALRRHMALEDDATVEKLVAAALSPHAFDEQKVRDAARKAAEGGDTFATRGRQILDWLALPQAERLARHTVYMDALLKDDGEPYREYANKKIRAAHPEIDSVLRGEALRLRLLRQKLADLDLVNLTGAAIGFGHDFIRRYTAAKRRRAVLDYNDLVTETLNLLQRPGIAPWILHKLDDGLDHLLVDEAQDTSRAQWDIVATLADEFFAGLGARDANRTLFVVGDEKQSIYSFQNAEPEAFAAMRAMFAEKIRRAEKGWTEIPLQVSFRSAPAILRAVDAVFAAPDARQGVSVEPVRHQPFKADTLSGRVEVWPSIPAPPRTKETEDWQLPLGYDNENDPQAEMATRIAATIKHWLRHGTTLPGMDRPIQPRDIMILLRNRGTFAGTMVRALKQKPFDVPVTGVDRMHLTSQLPVMDVLALIQFTLLPDDDLNLATVLRGPLLNLGEDDLMELAARRGPESLWHRLQTRAGEPSFHAAHAYLTAWLGRADRLTPFAMLTHILNAPCPGSAISGRRALWSRLGLDALDPIDELLNAAQNFSRRHAPSLQAFLHWLTASDSEIKRELDRGDDHGGGQVRIMTVHASKGLEAPIVFLPDTTGLPRAQDVPRLQWDEARHLPFYFTRKPEAGPAAFVWQEARQAQMEEYRRLLYVALTRASHRLYIGGWEPARNEGDAAHSWYGLVRGGLAQSEAHVAATQDPVEPLIVWEDASPAPVTEKEPAAAPRAISLPAWALEPAPAEHAPLAPLAPSHLDDETAAATPDAAYARGRLLHRLLQYLPGLKPGAQEKAAARFLATPQFRLSAAEQTGLMREVMGLLRHPDFAPLFGPGSRAEVPLAGYAGGVPVAGQVDRLVEHGDEIWVVDYKTNRPPPRRVEDVPPAYRRQMEAYRALLANVYKGRKIRGFLLWTYTGWLQELPFN